MEIPRALTAPGRQIVELDVSGNGAVSDELGARQGYLGCRSSWRKPKYKTTLNSRLETKCGATVTEKSQQLLQCSVMGNSVQP